MEVRISRILGEYYQFTRKEAEEYLRAGRVTCNGSLVGIGDKASVNDRIELDGVIIPLKGIFRKFEKEQHNKAISYTYGSSKKFSQEDEEINFKSKDLRKGRKNELKKSRGKNHINLDNF